MDRSTLIAFVRPLYIDVDGRSKLEDVERVSTIARLLHRPATPEAERRFETLLAFQGLGHWLQKVGNLSRAALALHDAVPEDELRRAAELLRHIDEPRDDPLRAIAAARLLDRAGVAGLAERLSRARREGLSIAEVVREELEPSAPPEWLPAAARPWLERRRGARAAFCRTVLHELALADLDE